MILTNCNTSKGRTAADLEQLKADPNFHIWFERLHGNINGIDFDGKKVSVKGIEVQDIDMFGPKFGFGKFNVKTQPFLPGIVFHRSPSVACLFLIKCEGRRYCLMTVQPRMPAGYSMFPELVAGMTDGASGQPKLVAAKEIKEETGLEILPDQLVDLGEATAFSKGQLADYVCHSGNPESTNWLREGDRVRNHYGWFNSAGGSSETTKFYLYEKEMGRKDFIQLVRKTEREVHGVKSEGERIRLIVVPLEHILEVSPSVTTGHVLSLLRRYEKDNWVPKNITNINHLVPFCLATVGILVALIVWSVRTRNHFSSYYL
jgi:8-oxo-dGTP pyrophosphatase MutT (NUDIX family)